MGVKISDRTTTFGETDVYSTHDNNRGSLGVHVVLSTAARNDIPLDRRKGTYESSGANATPFPMIVAVRDGLDLNLYWLKNEPGTPTTSDSDWEPYVAQAEDPFQGFFTPASTTLVNGTGTKGHYWIASVAGSKDFGAGSITFAQYDKAIYDGTTWQKIGAGSAATTWADVANKPLTFTPSTHYHVIADITGLQDALDNKVEIDHVVDNVASAQDSRVPSIKGIKDYTYSKTEINIKFTDLSTYGIKYSWSTITEREAQLGMVTGDLGIQQDTRIVYKYVSNTWTVFFNMDDDSISISSVTGLRDELDGLDDRIDTLELNPVINDTDDISTEGTTNKWWTNVRTISSVLTGYVKAASYTAIIATDTVLEAFGKLEKYIDSKLSIQPRLLTGTTLDFSTDTIYGSETTPETGNITASTTGAIVGVTNLIIHNSGTAPTFDSKFYKLSGSGTYALGVKNYIYCQYLSSTRIIYSINK